MQKIFEEPLDHLKIIRRVDAHLRRGIVKGARQCREAKARGMLEQKRRHMLTLVRKDGFYVRQMERMGGDHFRIHPVRPLGGDARMVRNRLDHGGHELRGKTAPMIRDQPVDDDRVKQRAVAANTDDLTRVVLLCNPLIAR